MGEDGLREKVVVGGRSAGLRAPPGLGQSFKWAGIEVNRSFVRESGSAERAVQIRGGPENPRQSI